MLTVNSFSKSNQYTNYSVNATKPNNVAFKGSFPHRLQAECQDEFHATSTQIYIRKYLEALEKGGTEEEILQKFFPGYSTASESDKEAYKNFINELKTTIDKADKSFKSLIPMLIPKTYYRGVKGSAESNRAIAAVLNANKGDVIKPDLGYPFATSSKSLAIDYAQDLSGNATPETAVVMKIKTPAGIKLARDLEYSRNPLGPQNVVFPRGANYEVVDKEVKDDITFVTLKYLNADGLK